MPFQIVRNDITKMEVDAIVNAAKPSLLGGGGVDGAIHAAAGPELLEECRALGGCAVGEAKLTRAYRLPCKYVIHTVGPRWKGGLLGEARQLASCYRASLALALERGCESVAFPLISAGAHGYPKERALKIAVDNIGEFLMEHDMTVYLVVFGQESVAIGHRLFADIEEYIDDHYAEAQPSNRPAARRDDADASVCYSYAPTAPMPEAKRRRGRPAAAASYSPGAVTATESLDERLRRLDESFQQMLLRKIDESGMTDAQCYKKANIDRKLFSKIRNDVHYRPSKTTAVAFAVALELDLPEARELLSKAGFALSNSSKFDVIVRYFIEKRRYNVHEINEVLFYYDQSLLGC